MGKKICYLLLFVFGFSSIGNAQTFNLPKGQKFQKVKFELINNLIIIPIDVNGSQLSFILDSGVSAPILFSLAEQDSIQINEVSRIELRGLGEGIPIEALKSTKNKFSLGEISNPNQKLYVVLDESLNFSPSLGIPVHGIIGYDLFRDFVVDINYSSKYIKFYDKEMYTYKPHKKSNTLPLILENRKAYVDASIAIHASDVPVRMLLDTGSSDAIWLFENDTITIPEKNYDDFLGRGLAGDIFGKRSKVSRMKLGKFELKDAKTAFPDTQSYASIQNLGNRNGSLGGEVLKRFNIVFNYSKKQITLRKNANFKAPFDYNMSGIDLQHNGVRYIAESIADPNGIVKQNESVTYSNVQILMESQMRLSLVPEIVVSGIRAGSPAESAGLQKGDVILAVNGKSVHTYKLQQILQMLNTKKGKRIRVLIERSNSDKLFTYVLKDMFKEKP